MNIESIAKFGRWIFGPFCFATGVMIALSLFGFWGWSSAAHAGCRRICLGPDQEWDR